METLDGRGRQWGEESFGSEASTPLSFLFFRFLVHTGDNPTEKWKWGSWRSK